MLHLRGKIIERLVSAGTKIIKSGRHRKFFPGLIDQRHIDGSPPVVAGSGFWIGHVPFVRHEFPQFFLNGERPIAIPHFKAEPVFSQAALNSGQAASHGAAQITFRKGIKRLTREVVRRCVSEIDHHIGRDGFNINKRRFAGGNRRKRQKGP